jgi:hypothetical protein
MPRYFFHIRTEFDIFADPEGIDLPDLETARAEALEVVWDLWDGMIVFGSGAVIEITDETRTVILTLPFVPAVKTKKGTLH